MPIAQTLTIIRIVFQLVPVIVEGIKALEEAIPGQGKGEQKIAALREVIEATYAGIGDALPAFAAVWPTIERLVAALVAGFNRTGEFSR